MQELATGRSVFVSSCLFELEGTLKPEWRIHLGEHNIVLDKVLKNLLLLYFCGGSLLLMF